MGNILLIGDIVGYGNLGTSVMIPILTKMNYEIYRMPTSLVSNNFSYGQFAVLDTTDYMRKCIDIWEDLGVEIDAVATGYLVSEEQTHLVTEYCKKLKARGTKIFVDPIMADDGKLYNGIPESTIEYMRNVCSVADVIVPNFTEAKFLADMFVGENSLTMSESQQLVAKLRKISDSSIVISSMIIEGQTCIMLYDRDTCETKILPYEMIPMQFSGTGDVFSSVLFGNILRGTSLESSAKKAMNFVTDVITKNINCHNPDNGIPIEKHLNDNI